MRERKSYSPNPIRKQKRRRLSSLRNSCINTSPPSLFLPQLPTSNFQLYKFPLSLSVKTTSMVKKKITLRSSDGETFEVEGSVAMESQTIKHMIEDDCAQTVIPLPNVTSHTLARVIEYCKNHVHSSESKSEFDSKALQTRDAEFIKVDQNTLFELILVRTPLFLNPFAPQSCCVFWFLFGYQENNRKTRKKMVLYMFDVFELKRLCFLFYICL